jgi:uncharacterized membrane protein
MSETSGTMPSWRRWALPASIILNLFLVALIGGHALRHRGIEASSATPFARALANAMNRLPSTDAAAFGAVIRRDVPRYAQSARELALARQALQRAVTADPFDQDKARQALAAWRKASGQFMDQFGDTLIDALAQVSPDGRRRLVSERRSLRPWFSLR